MRMGSIRWEESSTLDQPTLSAPHPDRPPPYNTTSIRYDRFQYYFICFLCRWRQKLTIPDLCSLTPTTEEVQHLPPRTTSRPQVVSHRGIWTLQRNMVIQISDSEKESSQSHTLILQKSLIVMTRQDLEVAVCSTCDNPNLFCATSLNQYVLNHLKSYTHGLENSCSSYTIDSMKK